jgi:hypothetical protein
MALLREDPDTRDLPGPMRMKTIGVIFVES